MINGISLLYLLLYYTLYGCETWSVTLREEFRLRVFKKPKEIISQPNIYLTSPQQK